MDGNNESNYAVKIVIGRMVFLTGIIIVIIIMIMIIIIIMIMIIIMTMNTFMTDHD